MDGFRYNARVLARHIAETLKARAPETAPIADVNSFLLHELSNAPELWVQKGYLCRVVARSASGVVDEGVLPLAHFLDSLDGDAAAASVEVDERGAIIPMVYLRRGGEISEHPLAPHPLHEYVGDTSSRELEQVLRQLPV